MLLFSSLLLLMRLSLLYNTKSVSYLPPISRLLHSPDEWPRKHEYEAVGVGAANNTDNRLETKSLTKVTFNSGAFDR